MPFTLLSLNTALLPYGLGIGNNINRTNDIINTILQLDYDIIALQEVFDLNCSDLFIEKLSRIYYYHASDVSDGRLYCLSANSGLMIFSKYIIKNSFMKHYSLHRNSDYFAKKGVLGVLINVDATDLYICNTHLQSNDNIFPLNIFNNTSLTHNEIRLHQISELVDELHSYITNNQPVIICGDLNTNTLDKFMDIIHTKFYDVKDIHNPYSTIQNTTTNGRIDYVLTNLHGTSIIINNFFNHSDHHAVVSIFT